MKYLCFTDHNVWDVFDYVLLDMWHLRRVGREESYESLMSHTTLPLL